MIISITGKPCSGKGTISEEFCKNHKFEYVGVSAIFRNLAIEKGFSSLAEFFKKTNTTELDLAVDKKIEELGIANRNRNMIIDSRTAWHFVPNSFKVYVDVDWEEAGRRLLNDNREGEKVTNLTQAKKQLKQRHKQDNERYKKLYNIDCTNLNNFDLVLDSTNKTPAELEKELYTAYKLYKNKRTNT